MYQAPFEKMVCDSDYGDGGIYFYETYFDWTNRDTGKGFRVNYSDIADVDVVLTHKKKVTVILKEGKKYNLYLYRYETLLQILYGKMGVKQGKNGQDVVGEAKEESAKETDLEKLERLAKLHESGALSDEEFQLAKDKILR